MLNIKLQNFRRFIETKPIAFEPGLTIVNGPNGAGKSTLAEAVMYALFGPKQRTANNIRSDNATTETCVECELIIDGKQIKIQRFNDRAGLWIDNALQVQDIPSSLSMADQQIKRLLGGLTRDQFESTYIALQGDTAGLVEDQTTADRRRRQQIIESVLQIEVLRTSVHLQGKQRDAALQNAKTLGRITITDLQLNTQATAIWKQFEDAHKFESRSRYAQQLQDAIEAAVALQQEAVVAAKQRVAETEVDIEQLERDRNQCAAAVNDAKQVSREHESRQKLYQQLDVRVAEQQGAIQTTEKSIDNLKAQIGEAEQCASAAQEHAQLYIVSTRLRARLASLPLVKERHTALDKAQAQVHDLARQLREMKSVDVVLEDKQKYEAEARQKADELKDDPTTEEFQAWNARTAEFQHTESQAQEALRTLQHAPEEARCPTCDQPFVTHTPTQRVQHLTALLNQELPRQRTQLEIQKHDLDVRKATWQQAQESAKAAWKQAVKAISEAEKGVARRDDLQHQYDKAMAAFETAQQAWDELQEQWPYDPSEEARIRGQLTTTEQQATSLEQAAKRYDQVSQLRDQLDQKQCELEQLRLTWDDVCAQQAAVQYDSEAHQKAHENLKEVQDKLMALGEKIRQTERTLDQQNHAVEQAGKAVNHAIQRQTELAEALATFYREDRLTILLSEFQKHFFTASTQQVARRAAQLVLHAVTDQSILGIEFDNHGLFYLDASRVRRPISRLSGGEKALVGLCLRIALAEQVQSITRTGNIRILILDEVLASLDEERRDAVQRIFDDVLQRGVFEHIIMITHLEAVKQDWQAAMVEVEKIDGKTSSVLQRSAVYHGLAEEQEV